MTLYTRIVAVVLVAVSVLLAVGGLKFQDVISHYAQTLENGYASQSRAIRRSLETRIREMRTAARALSAPEEIVNAVQAADNEVLFDWSNGFIGAIDTILFTDTAGLVLARAPDEFRFGYRIDHLTCFKQSLNQREFYGIDELDGAISIVIARSIHRYDDLPVGVVCIGVHLSSAFLQSLVEDAGAIVSFHCNGSTVNSGATDAGIVHSETLGGLFGESRCAADGSLTVSFAEDRNYRRLVKLKTIIHTTGLTTAIVLAGLLIWFLHRWLRPYSVLVQLILAYANAQVDAETLHTQLADFEHHSRHDARKIASALVQMLSVIKHNMDRIGAYNTRLNQTVADLEAALAKVKTLSGLLPICAHCKKIRDDQGYWSQIESYISAHSAAEFSHSICPECLKTHYPDFLVDGPTPDGDKDPVPGSENDLPSKEF